MKKKIKDVILQNAIDEVLPAKARKRRIIYHSGFYIDVDGTVTITTPEEEEARDNERRAKLLREDKWRK